jgi:ribosomal protein S18 acetylase RimI-like enzyme
VLTRLSIAVWEPFRDRGTGTMLLDETIGEARSRGYGGLSLSARRGNRSVDLYKRKGFKIVSRVDDAYTMYLDLRKADDLRTGPKVKKRSVYLRTEGGSWTLAFVL